MDIKSQKGKQQLLYEGYRYRRDKLNQDGSSSWRCIKRSDSNSNFFDFIVLVIALLSSRFYRREFVGAILTSRFNRRYFVGAHMSIAQLSGHGYSALSDLTGKI